MKELWLDDEDYPKGGCFIASGKGEEYETIAEMMGGDELSNAEFIIKACNNYEKMQQSIIHAANMLETGLIDTLVKLPAEYHLTELKIVVSNVICNLRRCNNE